MRDLFGNSFENFDEMKDFYEKFEKLCKEYKLQNDEYAWGCCRPHSFMDLIRETKYFINEEEEKHIETKMKKETNLAFLAKVVMKDNDEWNDIFNDMFCLDDSFDEKREQCNGYKLYMFVNKKNKNECIYMKSDVATYMDFYAVDRDSEFTKKFLNVIEKANKKVFVTYENKPNYVLENIINTIENEYDDSYEMDLDKYRDLVKVYSKKKQNEVESVSDRVIRIEMDSKNKKVSISFPIIWGYAPDNIKKRFKLSEEEGDKMYNEIVNIIKKYFDEED